MYFAGVPADTGDAMENNNLRAFPIFAGFILVVGVCVGIGFLLAGEDPKTSNAAKLNTDYQPAYSNVGNAQPAPVTTNYRNYRDSSGPLRTSPPPNASGPTRVTPQPGTSRPAAAPGGAMAAPTYVVDGGRNSLVAVEVTDFAYVPEIKSYVGNLMIRNMAPANVVDFRIELEVDDITYTLKGFRGKPKSAEPIEKSIKPGQAMDCPVIGKAKAPKKAAIKIVRIRFVLDGEPGNVETETPVR